MPTAHQTVNGHAFDTVNKRANDVVMYPRRRRKRMNGPFRAMVRSTPSCVRICSSISRTIDPDVDSCERFVNNR